MNKRKIEKQELFFVISTTLLFFLVFYFGYQIWQLRTIKAAEMGVPSVIEGILEQGIDDLTFCTEKTIYYIKDKAGEVLYQGKVGDDFYQRLVKAGLMKKAPGAVSKCLRFAGSILGKIFIADIIADLVTHDNDNEFLARYVYKFRDSCAASLKGKDIFREEINLMMKKELNYIWNYEQGFIVSAVFGETAISPSEMRDIVKFIKENCPDLHKQMFGRNTSSFLESKYPDLLEPARRFERIYDQLPYSEYKGELEELKKKLIEETVRGIFEKTLNERLEAARTSLIYMKDVILGGRILRELSKLCDEYREDLNIAERNLANILKEKELLANKIIDALRKANFKPQEGRPIDRQYFEDIFEDPDNYLSKENPETLKKIKELKKKLDDANVIQKIANGLHNLCNEKLQEIIKTRRKCLERAIARPRRGITPGRFVPIGPSSVPHFPN